tara:strand:+ start:126 stop:557 length:432 start_codon:yes stop_codon:yes gene_type:complete
MIISIIIVVIGIIIVAFLKDINSSKNDFKGKPMKEVFSTLIEYFNHGVFGGNVKIIERNMLNIILIHNVSSQHKVVMEYMKGELDIKWSWKYLHQELNHSITIHDVLNLSEDKMREIAKELDKEMAVKMKEHSDIINQMAYKE